MTMSNEETQGNSENMLTLTSRLIVPEGTVPPSLEDIIDGREDQFPRLRSEIRPGRNETHYLIESQTIQMQWDDRNITGEGRGLRVVVLRLSEMLQAGQAVAAHCGLPAITMRFTATFSSEDHWLLIDNGRFSVSPDPQRALTSDTEIEVEAEPGDRVGLLETVFLNLFRECVWMETSQIEADVNSMLQIELTDVVNQIVTESLS